MQEPGKIAPKGLVRANSSNDLHSPPKKELEILPTFGRNVTSSQIEEPGAGQNDSLILRNNHDSFEQKSGTFNSPGKSQPDEEQKEIPDPKELANQKNAEARKERDQILIDEVC